MKPIKPMLTKIPKSTRIAAVLIAAIAAGAVIGAAEEKKGAPKATATDASKPAPKPALTVNVTQPTSTDWTVNLTANGNIAPWQEAVIGAEVSGLRLTDVRVNVGDLVKRGQLLATLSTDTINAEITQQATAIPEAEAAIAEAEAALADAQANANRARTLQDSGALPAAQIAQYLTAEKTAATRVTASQARLAAAKAAQSSIQVRLGFTKVVAPDDGVISARGATVGAVVGAGQELFRLIRKGRLEWRGEVTANELAKVKVGQKVVVTLPSSATVNGKVRMIAPTVDLQTRNAVVYVDLDRHPEAISGMFAKGEFGLGASRALSVPTSALVARDGFTYVMKVDAQGKVQQRKISTGRRIGDRVELIDGVAATDSIVASGAAFLSDGDFVRVVPTSAAPK